MKLAVKLGFILLVIAGCAFFETKRSESSECIEAQKEAMSDVKRGKLTHWVFGSPIVTDWEKEFHFRQYLKLKKGIELAYSGCIVSDSKTCYKRAMDSAIYKRFGYDVIEKSRKKSDELFENGDKLPLDSSTLVFLKNFKLDFMLGS